MREDLKLRSLEIFGGDLSLEEIKQLCASKKKGFKLTLIEYFIDDSDFLSMVEEHSQVVF